MNDIKDFPTHLPKEEGWLMIQAELTSEKRIEFDEAKKFLVSDEDAEIGEFIQRGDKIRIIWKPSK